MVSGFGDINPCGLSAAGLLVELGVLVPELFGLPNLPGEPLVEGSHCDVKLRRVALRDAGAPLRLLGHVMYGSVPFLRPVGL